MYLFVLFTKGKSNFKILELNLMINIIWLKSVYSNIIG